MSFAMDVRIGHAETCERNDVYAAQCPCREMLDLLANKWSALAIGVLEEGPTRFGELRRRLEGVSPKVLSATLKRLESGGIVHRGQGKWYPGEPLPRWALACYWRKDGVPLWRDPSWLACMEGAPDVVADDTIGSLRRFKDDVTEVRDGFECGIGLDKFQDIKVGDEFEVYEEQEVARD